MAEEIAVENGRISNSEGLVTLTFTFYRVILHTVVHHSWTPTYMPNFIGIEETFVQVSNSVRPSVRTHTYVRYERTYVCKHGRTDGRTFDTGFKMQINER